MKKFFVLAAIVIIAVILSGCGEKAVEKAIKSSTGGSADVNIEKNSVSVNTNAGSLQVGEKVKLPAGFPSDVYVIDGDITSAMTMSERGAYTVAIQTSKTVKSVKEKYESELASDGWKVTMSLAIQDGFSLSAEKGDRMVTVGINKGDAGALVTLNTLRKK